MDRDRFRRLVHRSLRGLPPQFASYLDNVDIVIRREPSAADLEYGGHDHDRHDHGDGGDGHDGDGGHDLFGLYVGTPLAERENYGMTLPDRIVIFQGPLERHFSPREIPEEVRKTVVHEIAHHFGIDDDRLAALGLD